MDSGNSGSLQSSSGGDGGDGGDDDVYDSRMEPMFVNPNSTHFNPIPTLQPPPPPPHHHQPPSAFFDPTSFTQSLNPTSNPMYNLDSFWSRNPNPNPMYNIDPNPVGNNNTGPKSDVVFTRNPKKRTRASRRAPTTVLTTDTVNFRQMVQEFTGIPAAPFATSSNSSSFSRRLDLYGGGIAPVHSLRPSYMNSVTATTSNFQLPPSETHGFTKQPLNLSNLQSQMFPFQSVSQTALLQQVNVTERENQRSGLSNAFPSSSTSLKRWRGQADNMMNFEVGSENNHNGVVSSRGEGDQLPGNEDSWNCPSD